MVKPDQNSNVEKLVFGNLKITQDGALRGRGEQRRAGSKVKRGNQFVDPRIEQGISWTIDCMDI